MRKTIVIISMLMMGLGAVYAQDTNDATDSNAPKSQQQIMDEFNSRANVDMKLYPNPAVNYLNVEASLRSDAGFIRIMDITGALKTEMRMEPGSNGLTIDLSQYAPGLYILTYYDSTN
ncbi:MAG TPA: T9SS type A sorting domain-containing protein, partial [Chitinophagales bacterium]|nr:T9SS type A sorting domain-containing protein [Chitinophagales bacterium]